ncbi:MAG: PASTA domain-containing protein, partial [Phycisphaerales bacterium]
MADRTKPNTLENHHIPYRKAARMYKRISFRLVLALAVGSFAIVAPATAQKVTIVYVDRGAKGANDGTSWADAYVHLQDALVAATGSTDIRVAQGTYLPDKGGGHTLGDRTASFQLKQRVSLLGGYAGYGELDPDARSTSRYETTLSGDIGALGDNSDNSYHVVNGSGCDGTADLDGFTITGGNADGSWPNNSGGGMYISDGSPTVTDCTFSSNSGRFGGGMCNDDSNPTVTDCTFSGNSASSGGGMYNFECNPTLTNSTFSDNSAEHHGGGMYNEGGSPKGTNCTFNDNTAEECGGGMYNHWEGNPTLTDCTFSGNSALDDGGGMYNKDSSPTLTNCAFSSNDAFRGGGMHNNGGSPTVANCTFSGNSALDDGGGTYNESSSPTVTDCAFTDNSAPDDGGGMYNESSSPTVTDCAFTDNSATYGGGMYIYDGSPTVTNCTFSGNSAGYGGGMRNWLGNPRLTDCTFSDNTATHGGGMHNTSSHPTVTNCSFSGNSAEGYGGGMANPGSSPTVTDCTFSGNSATCGGGMSNELYDNPTVTDCTFSGNEAEDNGGGMYNWRSSPTVTNCTFSDNSARRGGGMYNGDKPWVTNCTFSSNEATVGGGMYNAEGTQTVVNCILWGDTPEEIAGDGFPTVISSNVEGGWLGGTNIDADPLFEAGTLRLSAGSPCIDAGANNMGLIGITTDLDGNPRFVDDPATPDTGPGTPPIVDIGAYEFQPPPPPMVEVPDVVGRTLAEANSLISAADLTVGRISLVHSDTVPTGYVIRQNPVGGTEVLEGTRVDLTVSLGPAGPGSVVVPDVVAESLSAAQSAITSAGLVVGTTSANYSDTVPAGYVISQDPTAGTQVPGGSAVDLVISLGPKDGPSEQQACCFADGSCQDLTPGECLAQGGTPQGAGTTCATTDCQQPP